MEKIINQIQNCEPDKTETKTKPVQENNEREPESDNTYMKRAKFLKDHSLPRVDEIRLNIGSQLANIFFTEGRDPISQWMGKEKALEGPKEQMWVSPGDQLMGKVVLTEPYPRQFVQVMTHENILEIGEKLEDQYEKARVEELEAALLKKEQEVRKEMEEDSVKQLDQLRTEMENIYRNRLQYTKQQLVQQFQEQMNERDMIMCKKAEQKVHDSLSYLRKSMAEEMEIIAKRSIDYNDKVNRFQRIWDANKAHEVFKKKVNNLKKKWIKILKKARRLSESEKRDFKKKFMEFHNEEIERIKEECNKEFKERLLARTYNYRRTICDLLKEIKRKDAEYEQLKSEKECAHVEQYSWCYLVRELLKQFQKFINYALQKKPGHAEFMISLDKILQTRINSLTEAELLQKYIEEKGAHLIEERLKAEDAELRMRSLYETPEEEKEEQKTMDEYLCLPEDSYRIRERKRKEKETKEVVKDIKTILDKVVERATPRGLTELPCIESELWSSVKSVQLVAWPEKPKPPGLKIAGEDAGPSDVPFKKFKDDRIVSLVRVLHRHPAIKLAIVGNS